MSVHQEIVDWFNSIRAVQLHYLKVAFPGATDGEVSTKKPIITGTPLLFTNTYTNTLLLLIDNNVIFFITAVATTTTTTSSIIILFEI